MPSLFRCQALIRSDPSDGPAHQCYRPGKLVPVIGHRVWLCRQHRNVLERGSTLQLLIDGRSITTRTCLQCARRYDERDLSPLRTGWICPGCDLGQDA
jgi:hypothetical protein